MPRFVRLLILALLVPSLSCGGSPASPTAAELPFRAGAYVLSVSAPAAVSVGGGPAQPACSGEPGAPVGAVVSTDVIMELTASGWRVRPTTASGGSFEIRFFRGTLGLAPTNNQSVELAASATGTVNNTRALFSPLVETYLLLGLTSRLTGGVSQDGGTATGVMATQVQFANGDQTVTCNPGTVPWSLSR